MIIAPLVLLHWLWESQNGDTAMIGRVGGKSLMLWFITASLVSLLLGLVFVNWLEHWSRYQIAYSRCQFC